MKTKTRQFVIPNESYCYLLEVRQGGAWLVYVQDANGEIDWANPLEHLGELKSSVRQTIKLEIEKFTQDLAAETG